MLSGLNLFAQQQWSFHLKSQNIQFYLKIHGIFLKLYLFKKKKKSASVGSDNKNGYKAQPQSYFNLHNQESLLWL